MKHNLTLACSFLMLCILFFQFSCTVDYKFQRNSTFLLIDHVMDFDISGKGNSGAWKKTDWINLEQRDTSGYCYKTKVKSLYSDTGIYFLFDCEDSVITSTLNSDYADLYNEDVVEVFLWTSEEYPFYFEYELSPHNFELPIMVPNVRGDFFGWKPWHYEGDRKTRHATSINVEDGKIKGWKAEMFIPFALLKPLDHVPPDKGTEWRVNMYRIDYDKEPSDWTWQPVKTNFHDYEHFGTFKFN